jgi:hypothetical protein
MEDPSKAPIAELESNILEAGEFLLAADEVGGAVGESHWDFLIANSSRELLRWGTEGEKVIATMLTHPNAEVILAAAAAALEADFQTSDAKLALQKLVSSSVGNGWPAHYARKTLALYL